VRPGSLSCSDQIRARSLSLSLSLSLSCSLLPEEARAETGGVMTVRIGAAIACARLGRRSAGVLIRS
jgi:hypothetical protein